MGQRHSRHHSPPPTPTPTWTPPPPPTPRPRPPPSPTLREPWRKINWGNKEVDLQYVRDYQTERDDIKHLRILLYGPVGAGKSSFINSVSNVLRGRMTNSAEASAQGSEQSFTKIYRTHKIRKGKGKPQAYYPIVLNDIMGLEDGCDSGVRPDDIILAMKGHVKDGYTFNPVSSLSSGDQYYNPEPSAEDKVHVLVCMHSANSAEIKESVLQKMKDIREAASKLGIPQMAMITKIDEACGETKKDLKNVYKSKHLKKKMEAFSTVVGIPMNRIFPLKNYSHEIENNDDVDTLILSILRGMIDFGDDFIDQI